ncbi:patatin-like phospholipase family protein [Brumicola blandensis]|uniref:Patatin-like phospholipase family protein n=1 Tax=Brumicola blandensis TaxID=3075611 RepID=A0AAW8R2I5_9ALTE|nr:patatin-like phospholipase family protein [Alteromonas sp. W409]MDT0582532.1 patatin-like phospholipase family protein [Alteromonas sp. W409]
MTTLKLGFAMGGGVSLGTFNAGALSQTIKLAILYGQDRKGALYDKVEIDVFSGASAGSISLAIMLRALSSSTKEQLQQADRALKDEFGEDYTNLPSSTNKKAALQAVQVMQTMQEQVWVEKVSMDALLDPISNEVDNPHSLKFSAGLLNRAALENIASELLKNTSSIDTQQNQEVLAERVLFASSLSNLTPILQDARQEFDASSGSQYVLADGMTSVTHRETRIFDLYFGDQSDTDYINDKTKYPERWTRYHLGDPKNNVIGDMRGDKKDVWKRIISTAIASGAFPMAFEPVVLERYQFEYGPLWPKELANEDQFDFTYIDGGVFNNEPIRDAFKLASFIDAHDERLDTERCIIFVDPAVTDIKTSFMVPVQKRFTLTTPILGDNIIGNIDGIDLEAKASLDRLLSHIATIGNAIFMQARAIEGDKVFAVRKQMELRDKIRQSFAEQASDTDVSVSLLSLICQQLDAVMQKDLKNILLPPSALSLSAEAKRVYREVLATSESVPQTLLHPILEISYANIDSDLEKLLDSKVPTSASYAWFLLLNFIQIDQSMRLSGKSDTTRFIAIGPFEEPSAPTLKQAKKIALPGDKLIAFGGFMYERTRAVDLGIGKFCATKALLAAELISADVTIPDCPKLNADEEDEYQRMLDKGIKAVLSRVVDMVRASNIPIVSNIPKGAIKWLLGKVTQSESLANTYELRIELPEGVNNLEFDGRGKIPGLTDKDIKPVKLNGKLFLITFADFDETTSLWNGPHISKQQQIHIDQNGFIDKTYASISTPDAALLDELALSGYSVLTTKLKKQRGRTQKLEWHVAKQLTALSDML